MDIFPRRLPLPFLILLSISICLFLGYSFHIYEPAIQYNGDINEYWKEADLISAMHEGQVVELAGYYPPLASVVFYTAYNNLFNLPFHRGFLFTMILCAIVAGNFIAEILHKDDLRYLIVAVPAMIVLLEPIIFFARFDFFPMLTILLLWLCMRRERYAWASAFLVTGILLKFSPIFLTPLVFACTPKEKHRQLLLGSGMALVVLGSLMIFILTWQGMIDITKGFLSMRSGHPPYVFSTFSSIDLFMKMLMGMKGNIQWIGPNLGHFNLGFPSFTPLLLQFFSIAGAVCIACIAHKDPLRLRNMALYISAVMLWVLATTPLLTMHYYLWILPIPLAWFLEETETTGQVKRWQLIVGLLTVSVALLGQYFYPYAYSDLVHLQTPIAVTLNLLRNLLTFVLVYVCLQAVRRQQSTPPPPALP